MVMFMVVIVIMVMVVKIECWMEGAVHGSSTFRCLIDGGDFSFASDGVNQVLPAQLLPRNVDLLIDVGMELIIGFILVLEYIRVLAPIHGGKVGCLARQLQYLQGANSLVVLTAIIQGVGPPEDVIHVEAGLTHPPVSSSIIW